jgi:hypothetical protein
MGYHKHDVVVVTMWRASRALREHSDDPDEAAYTWEEAILALREKMGVDGKLLVGPIEASPLNDYVTYVLVPDGSKEGWADSERFDGWRERLLEICRTHCYGDGSGLDYVAVRFGGDDPEMARVEESTQDRLVGYERAGRR